MTPSQASLFAPSTFQLASIAPRLALARDQHNRITAEHERKRAALVRKIHQTERLVAHRELQLIRAGHTGDPRYIGCRQRKLAAAERSLNRLKGLAV